MTGELPGRPCQQYGVVACPSCSHGTFNGLRLLVTGRVEMRLFPWQGGRHPKHGPRFGDEARHPEAEVVCGACGHFFFTPSGAAVADATARTAPAEAPIA